MLFRSGLASKFVTAADTDKSGGLSLDELTSEATKLGFGSDSTALSTMFGKVDTNGDGSLSADEIAASAQPPRSGELAKSFLADADTDKSGGLSLDELTAESSKLGGGTTDSSSLAKLFDKLDTNKDGSLDSSELQSAFQHHHHHHDSQVQSASSTDASTDGTTSSFAQKAAAAYSFVSSIAVPAASMLLL